MRVANNTEWLFFHLWKKNPETSQSCPNVNIIETVLFRWAQPYYWYSTAKDGTLVRKTKDKVVLAQVEEAFMHNMSKCNVVATCLNSQENANFKTQEKIEFEYIDTPNFHNFLFQKEKPMNLIIHKFLEPKGNKNALIKVSWTPQFCIFFRKTNINDLTNTKIPLINRLTTFEGAEHLSASDSVSTPALVTDLEQTCLNIARHIQSVTGGSIHISKMVLYFKLDERNRLWLLFCTNLRFKEKISNTGKAVAKKKSQRPLSPLLTATAKKEEKNLKVIPQPQYVFEGQLSEANTETCLRCGSEGLLFDIKIKLLLDLDQKHEQTELEEDHHDSFMDRYRHLEELEKRSKGLPEIIKKLYPYLTEEKYIKLKNNPSFMNTPVKACENCYTIATEFVPEPEERRVKSIKLKLSGDRSPVDSPFGTIRDMEGSTPMHQQPSPLEGSQSPTRLYMHSSRSLKFPNALSRNSSTSKPNKPSAFAFHPQTPGTPGNRDSVQRPRSGFPYVESYREGMGSPLTVKGQYFRVTSALSSPPKEAATTKHKSTLSPYAYEMNIISPLASHRKLSCRPATAMKKTQMGQKLSDLLRASPSPRASTWGQQSAKKVSRTNYSSMMSTIKDLKNFLEQNME